MITTGRWVVIVFFGLFNLCTEWVVCGLLILVLLGMRSFWCWFMMSVGLSLTIPWYLGFCLCFCLLVCDTVVLAVLWCLVFTAC